MMPHFLDAARVASISRDLQPKCSGGVLAASRGSRLRNTNPSRARHMSVCWLAMPRVKTM